jgi:hypothetical protein
MKTETHEFSARSYQTNEGAYTEVYDKTVLIHKFWYSAEEYGSLLEAVRAATEEADDWTKKGFQSKSWQERPTMISEQEK